MSAKADVLIVGAGPCGLMLANELGRRGIETIVLDRDETVATAPQANATQARSMEHYRRLGFAHEIRKMGMPGEHPTDVAYFTTYAGHELARKPMPCSNEADGYVRQNPHVWNGPELPHRIPQSLVEQTLLRKAEVLEAVRIHFNTEFNRFIEDDNGIIADVTDLATGRTRLIRTEYLFGADGSQSTLRRQLGIRYGGADLKPRDFMGGQMLSIYVDAPGFYDLGVPRAWMYWTFNRRRRALLATVDGQGKFVLQSQLREGEELDTITENRARELFLQAVGKDIPCKVTGIASWLAGRALVADSFAEGRVFLGGDAVHLFTPTGGMGYNTAIEDAVNIGWKLASVIRGVAHPDLLKSYSAERRPIALRNTEFALAFADSVGLYVPSPAIEDDGPAGQAARARAAVYLSNHAANEFSIPGFTLGGRYDSSPVIVGDGTPAPPDAATVYVPTAKPGGRAPHVWLKDGRSLFDALGFEWNLLCFEGDRNPVDMFAVEANKMGLALKVLDLSDEPVAQDLYEAPFALLRPDQIVAWRGSLVSQSEVRRILERVTGWASANVGLHVG